MLAPEVEKNQVMGKNLPGAEGKGGGGGEKKCRWAENRQFFALLI